jgi:predicted lipid-binding transport protein (Tim44 family)
MFKLLLLIAIIVVAVLLARRALKSYAPKQAVPRARPADPAAAAPDAKLVRCVECGAFVPKSGALPVSNGFRCGGAGCAISP